MPDMTNPELLIMPLAKDGDKNELPETTGSTTGLFSQKYGFQEITQTPLTAGGKAPDRKDFNAAFNLLGGVAFFAQKGWSFHYDGSQDYYKGCVVIDPADGKRYECIADMTAGTVAPSADTDNTYWQRYTLGDGIHVGMIIPWASNSQTLPGGYLECLGQAVSRTMYPDLFEAIGTTYGAGDGSTTFNLPDLTDKFIEGSLSAGTEKEAGLPNITGSVGREPTTAGIAPYYVLDTKSGALDYSLGNFREVDSTTGIVSGGSEISFDASKSSSIYGNSTTVQPPALTTRYIIKAFDGQTADSALIDITQYASDLANRLTREQTPAFNHRDVITVSGTYTAPVTGWYRITAKGGGGGGQGGGILNSNYYGGSGGSEGGTTIAYEYMVAGDTATVVVGAGGAGGAKSTSSGGGVGSEGGNSSVTINLTTYTGGGGSGGNSSSAQTGGTGTISGAPGGNGNRGPSISQPGGNGGGSGGGHSTSGINGGGGSGGSVTVSSTTTAINGFAGGNGYVTFEYFDPVLNPQSQSS